MYKNDKVIRPYSKPFKLKILDEINTGKLDKNQLVNRSKNIVKKRHKFLPREGIQKLRKSLRNEFLKA